MMHEVTLIIIVITMISIIIIIILTVINNGISMVTYKIDVGSRCRLVSSLPLPLPTYQCCVRKSLSIALRDLFASFKAASSVMVVRLLRTTSFRMLHSRSYRR